MRTVRTLSAALIKLSLFLLKEFINTEILLSLLCFGGDGVNVLHNGITVVVDAKLFPWLVLVATLRKMVLPWKSLLSRGSAV